jgi:hypothetical protein
MADGNIEGSRTAGRRGSSSMVDTGVTVVVSSIGGVKMGRECARGCGGLYSVAWHGNRAESRRERERVRDFCAAALG